MAFDFGLWSEGAIQLLFVCEEAHRYASVDRKIGFGPTRRAISRIAKEGRKYGVFLGLVTQRPAELDPTILSQCSTLFAMRLSNDRDQALVRSAVSDAAASLLAFLPSLATREVFAFGEGVALPTRLQFRELPAHLRSEGRDDRRGRTTRRGHQLAGIHRCRDRTLARRDHESAGQDRQLQSGVRDLHRAASAATGPSLEPDRFRILKRPVASDPARPQAAAVPPPLRRTEWQS